MHSRAMPPGGQSFRDAARYRPTRAVPYGPSRAMPARHFARPHRIAAYFFSGSVAPGCLNGNVLNIDFAWFCICSCICTNMFFDCSM